MSEYDLAHRVGREMFARDPASQAMGMTLLEIAPGSARLRMPVREDMLNGHGTCHGGIIFTFADSAFAFACNARNEVTVAQGAQISFVRPARGGDVLEAHAAEVTRAGRTGVYDVEVRDQKGHLIALFRGNSYRLQGHVVPVEGEASAK
ncbi:MAG: hydroxyphenylacetyl-CoA thioesterase PaaI [Geminicoccaceae bacterium]